MRNASPSAASPERGRYVIVRFDFSAFNDKLETLEERFEGHCFIELRHALERHPDLFSEAVEPGADDGEDATVRPDMRAKATAALSPFAA